MEAKELRIGNWVRGFIGEFPISAHAINELDNNPDYEVLKPVPLTGDRLVAFGVKKINNSMFRMGAITFQFHTDMSLEAMQERDIKDGFRICLNGKFICNLFYIHEIQNLYYALTGEELTIKDGA